MKTWKIKDRANDMEVVKVKFDPESLKERQIDRILAGWRKHGIPDWARKAIERGDAIKSES